MENLESPSPKTVPPLRIKNVRSLQTFPVSDESGSESSSDNQNLMIDEVYEISASEADESENRVAESDKVGYDADRSSRLSSNRQSTNSNDSSAQQPLPMYSSQTAQNSKASRRKSHHVPKQVDDVVFEETTILSVPNDNSAEPSNDSNKNLMKHIAMLKSCINYVLEQQDFKPIVFKHNLEKVSKLIDQYNQMKSSR
ncbi:uncharacterized protein LOC129726944 [Wyeomyia smithii]|uniref:uncharacterized protein LOC129726944 n=1 Tax=Wyeomyia smithii TaxID=174621 RepID=UPI0024681C80|nr:uncharacterized protein LOC129726944 [Wyeomyia smithii]